MLFAWIGYLKPGSEIISQDVQRQENEFIRQPYITIHGVGPLHDGAGKRSAMMMLFEVDDWPAARAFVANSPFLAAGLYERHDLFEYATEVGAL